MSPITPDRTPVLIGVGEASRATLAGDYLHPLDLAAAAARAAAADAGLAGLAAVETLVAIRSFHDSGVPCPFGGAVNSPRSLARRLGIDPAHALYGEIGGHSPQRLVHEYAAQIASGAVSAVLFAGAEATGSVKRAMKAGVALDWVEHDDGAVDDRHRSDPILSRDEIRHGIVSMPLAYSLIENARRREAGSTHEQHRAAMAKLWAPMARVAGAHPHAQFPRPETSIDRLATLDADNYRLTDIYSRWLVAQDAVDLGAALLLTSVDRARALGVPEDRWVWPLGGGDADDTVLSERPDPARSSAMAAAFDAAFEASGIAREAVGPVDLYSCFPCAVATALEAARLPDGGRRDLSLTGGLTFFGGPGNNYALHSIAAVARALRKDRTSIGLISANGGVLTKHSVGIYAARRPDQPFRAITTTHAAAHPGHHGDGGNGTVETYTIGFSRDSPTHATLFIATDTGRALARVDRGDSALDWLLAHDPIGVRVGFRRDEKVNRLTAFGG